MKKILTLIILFQSCLGAGDMLAKREKITGNYYLVEQEDGGYGIAYKIDGSFIYRTPPHSRLKAYAFKDSVLVMKTQDYNSEIYFYVLNMNKDNGYSNDKEIFVDTIPEVLFTRSWIAQGKYKFIQVK
jgi:hypothetical protein